MTGWVGTLLCPAVISGNSLDVSDFVIDPTNARAGLQAALNALSATDTILNFTPGQTYIIDGALTIAGKNGWKLVGNGATIKGKDNSPVGMLIDIGGANGCNDWVIDALHTHGNRATRGPLSESAIHNIRIQNCRRFTVMNSTVEQGLNDGIQIRGNGVGDTNPNTHSYDGLLFNLTVKDSWRNNMTLAGGHNIQIVGGFWINGGSTIAGVLGTPPSSGIDVEPDALNAVPGNSDILIRGVTFFGNNGSDIQLSPKAGQLRITIEENYFGPQGPNYRAAATRGCAVHLRTADTLIQKNLIEDKIVLTARSVIAVGDGAGAGNVIDGNSVNDCTMNEAIFFISNNGSGVLTNNKGFNVSAPFVVDNGAGWTASNNPVEGAPTSPTSPPPPVAVDLTHCNLGGGGGGGGGSGGGAVRAHASAIQLTRQTVVNNPTPQNVLRLTHTPADNSTWWYIGTALIDNSATTSSALARLRQSTAAVDFGNVDYAPAAPADSSSIVMIGRQTYGVAPGSQDIDFDLSTSGTNTAGLDDMRIIGFEASADDKFASSDAETLNATDVFVTKVTLSDAFTGDYLFLFSAEIKGLGTPEIAIQADIDGTKYGLISTAMRQPAATQYRTWTTGVRKTGLTGAHTATIEFKRVPAGATGVGCRKARIIAIPLSGFAANYYVEDRTRTTTVATTPQDKSILTQITPAGDHMIFGGLVVDGNLTTFSTNAAVEQDAIDHSLADDEPLVAGNSLSYFVAAVETLTAASHTWKTQFFSENAALTTGAAESWLLVIAFAAPTTPVTVNSIGLGLSVLGGIGITSIPGIKGRRHVKMGAGAGIDTSVQNG